MAQRNTTGGATFRRGGGRARRDDGGKQYSSRKKNQEMSEQQIVGFLGRKIVQAMNDEDGDLSDVRKENLNYYLGAEYGDEREGYSSFVTREVLETVEQTLPSVLRVFLGGDDVVTFDPVGPEDEEAAKQETDITNYFVLKANNNGYGGFLPFHHWMKDALMYPTAYIKVYMEECEKTDVQIYTGLNEFGVQAIANNPDAEILEQRSMTQFLPTGELAEVFDLKVRTTRMVRQLQLRPVPGDECLVDNDLTSTNLDEADFVCHRNEKSFTQLVNEGLDPDELEQVGGEPHYQWNDERVNRMFYEDENPDASDEDDASMRMFWVHECYAKFDFDGDGLAEHRRVLLIGDKVFENEEIDYQPMVALSAILMPHTHTGMAYAELVKDLQLLNSILYRQVLDNIYKVNTGQHFVSEDSLTEDGSTMQALMNRQAEIIPVRGDPTMAAAARMHTPIIEDILPLMSELDSQIVKRTGVSPESALDANALQEVRQDVFANAMDRASQRLEMLTRIFAETGYRQVFTKAHQLLRSHWDIQKTVKIRGKWVNVDPQGWRDRTDLTINVGLGHSTKHQMLSMLVQMLSMQKEALPEGLATPSQIYNTLERLINAAGLGDPRMAFVDPDSEQYQPPEPPPPSAQDQLAQAQAQALMGEVQIKQQKTQIDAQQTMQRMQQDAQKSAQDMQLKQAELQVRTRELALREIELEQEGRLKAGELAAKIENIRADTQLKHANADKAMADAASTAVEAGETFAEAQRIVAEGGEMSDMELEAELDGDEG